MSDPTFQAVDSVRLLHNLGGNQVLMRKLADAFEQSLPAWLEDLHSALQNHSPDRFSKAAHKIKGALATLSADHASRLAQSLEEMGKTGGLANAPTGVANLASELIRVRESLRTIIAEFAKTDLNAES
jgi:HPt (histidine-containing phosphotransfer) domain-containing protein